MEGITADPGGNASQGASGLVGRLLENLRGVVGDRPALALFQCAAFEEGRRIGADDSASERASLQRAAQVLGMRMSGYRDTPHGAFVALEGVVDEASFDPVVLGILEGAITACRKRRFKGRIERREGITLFIALEEEPHA